MTQDISVWERLGGGASSSMLVTAGRLWDARAVVAGALVGGVVDIGVSRRRLLRADDVEGSGGGVSLWAEEPPRRGKEV